MAVYTHSCPELGIITMAVYTHSCPELGIITMVVYIHSCPELGIITVEPQLSGQCGTKISEVPLYYGCVHPQLSRTGNHYYGCVHPQLSSFVGIIVSE